MNDVAEIENKSPMTTQHVYRNLTPAQLIEHALARQEGELASNQALTVNTGKRTGRSPKDRFIVRDDITENAVDWGAVNQPLAPEAFDKLWEEAAAFMKKHDLFVADLQVGADPQYAIPVTVYNQLAWQNLFVSNLFIHPEPNQSFKQPRWEILSMPGFTPDPARHQVNGDAAIILNFSKRRILVAGTYYAGEIKKAMFTVLNFMLPEHEILPMHCSANQGEEGDVALFFGLSGTGKTTLSADPNRFLIGDDEHGWGEDTVFNFEGGCYAKCIDLSKEREPIIWDAIRFGSVLENVVIDPKTKVPDYSDVTLSANGRAAYPREFIEKRVMANRAGEPKSVVFLTCDLYGVLPPVSRLNLQQAAYHFLSGYTALVGSTEVGNEGNAIKSTFSTCFGAPFFPRRAAEYAELLMKRVKAFGSEVYLVNTGWTGGSYGFGSRFSIPTTRAVITAILSGELRDAEFVKLPGFEVDMPTQLSGVDTQLLDPRTTWASQEAYKAAANTLIAKFTENFKRFAVSEAVNAAGPVMIA
ncbi:MAG: pckA [Gammaproteobacteria bacterium]|jgi:phosphoenolpyruvate carboxykinase (ATP)|nr:pckA [Gammaproteobacteria bacterium]